MPTCFECNGSGECPVCRGLRIDCSSCHGTGKTDGSTCETCNGTGAKTCTLCNGTNHCFACKGTGNTA